MNFSLFNRPTAVSRTGNVRTPSSTSTLAFGGHGPAPTLTDSVSLSILAAQRARIGAEQLFNQEQRMIVPQAVGNLAQALGLPPERQELLRLAGQVYNLGKDPAANPVWLKAAPLTRDELRETQRYPLDSVNRIIALSATKRAQGLVNEADQLDKTIPIVLTHKYNVNGLGYPGQSLAGAQIPIEAQILGVVDAYYAMISQRPYRPVPLSPQTALQALHAEAGVKWNPLVVDAFIRKTQ